MAVARPRIVIERPTAHPMHFFGSIMKHALGSLVGMVASSSGPSSSGRRERTTQRPPTERPENGEGTASDRAITTRGWGVEIEAAFERGDFDEALRLAETILELDPENPDAAQLATSARLRLRHRFIADHGATTRTPRLLASPEQVARLDIDAPTGFVLSLVGRLTVDEISDVVPKPEHETLSILRLLIDRGVVELDR
jgi:hypothetical protein